jgi:hypothetical protein
MVLEIYTLSDDVDTISKVHSLFSHFTLFALALYS